MHGFWTTSFDLLRRLRRLFSFLIINIAELFRWSCGELNVFFLFLNGISSTCKRVPFSQKESSFSSAQVESLVLDTPMISVDKSGICPDELQGYARAHLRRTSSSIQDRKNFSSWYKNTGAA
jgi:hypothetical protein